MRIERGDAVALARALVAIDSRNPSLVPGGPGEGAVAKALAGVLETWGFRVELTDAAPGRPNVIARIGRPGGPALMFNGHLDVVGVDGMIHEPWVPEEREGKLYGRGSSDMKSGVAAMCSAAAIASEDPLECEVVIAAVVDEEFESLGTRDVIARGIRAEAAIVTEPTRLRMMPAHKGFVWVDVTVHGRAAHGSRWDIGIDAIGHAGLLLAELHAFDSEALPRTTHPLLGRPSIHASFVTGGTGMSTYPDRCDIRLERRTIPGERAELVVGEVEGAIRRVTERQPDFRADVTLSFEQRPSDVPVGASICQSLRDAMVATGLEPRIEGMSAWTDAALLNDAGIPAICFGPGDISLAHSAEEFVSIDEIRRATKVLTTLVRSWSRGERGSWVA